MRRTDVKLYAMVFGLAFVLAETNAAYAAQDEINAAPQGPDKLVNIDTPTLAAPGKLLFDADMRLFGGNEKNLYGTLQAQYGLRNDFSVILRGTAGTVKTYRTSHYDVNHGGRSLELMGKYSPATMPDLAVQAGVEYPYMPISHDRVYITASALYQHAMGEKVTAYFSPKLAYRHNESLVGIGGGVNFKITDTLSLAGDVTGLVRGYNAPSIEGPTPTRSEVWGVTLRYEPKEGKWKDYTVQIGITNGIGGTTALSMTPGLSGSSAVIVGITYKH